MKKAILILAILLFAASVASADGDAGLTGPFLRNGIGARPLGMGGAYTAIAEGPEATYYNPSGLGFLSKTQVSLSYKTMSLDRHLSQVAVSFPIRNEAAMAASWINSGTSNVPGASESREPLGNVANNDNAFALSFAKAVNSSIALGGSLKYLQQKLDLTSAFTIGVDVGALANIKKMASVGVVVQNIGSSYRIDGAKEWTDGKSYDDKFPLTVKFGAAGHLLGDRLIPAIDFEKSGQMNIRFRAGGEFWFVKTTTREVPDEFEEGKMTAVEENVRWAALRAGLDRGAPTFGASYFFFIKKISAGLEYAYLVGNQGTSASHLLTLKLGF
jgi:hypothetical protein